MILAFDFGMNKIGIAVGNLITKTASSLTIISALNGAPKNWLDIENIINQYKPELLIVGNPLNMDGTESEISLRAQRFANRLNGRFNIKTILQDERLTSFEAKQYSNKSKIDDLAATIILQSYLEQLSNE